jgi:DNA-binding response OmpR family regulator
MTDTRAIAIIDDDPVMLELLQRRLPQRLDLPVMLFPGGESYLEFFADKKPSIVLLDANLEGMSGMDVLARIRESYSRVELPVIFISGDNASESVVTALEAGANDYVVKPLDIPVLVARMRVHLSLPGAEKKPEVQPEASGLVDGQSYNITFLYCQIRVDSGFASSHQGAEIRSLLSAAFDMYSRVVERYRGSLWLRKDDSGFFAFQGSDPMGPVMCAIELLTMSTVHGLLQERGRHFSLSIGISAGNTVYRRDASILQSDALNQSAHLAKEPGNNAIRLSADLAAGLSPAARRCFSVREDSTLVYNSLFDLA